jgi:hypothetical protein
MFIATLGVAFALLLAVRFTPKSNRHDLSVNIVQNQLGMCLTHFFMATDPA